MGHARPTQTKLLRKGLYCRRSAGEEDADEEAAGEGVVGAEASVEADEGRAPADSGESPCRLALSKTWPVPDSSCWRDGPRWARAIGEAASGG